MALGANDNAYVNCMFMYMQNSSIKQLVFVLRFRQVEYNCSEAMDVLLDTKSVTIHWAADQHMELRLKFIIGEYVHLFYTIHW